MNNPSKHLQIAAGINNIVINLVFSLIKNINKNVHYLQEFIRNSYSTGLIADDTK